MKKILVVDDDPDITEIVKLILTRNGFEVYIHSTGYKVPEAVKECAPNLILLDINLPGRSGIDICKDLKDAGTRTPVLLFSAHAKIDSIVKCKADGFVQKPFDVKELVETVHLHLN